MCGWLEFGGFSWREEVNGLEDRHGILSTEKDGPNCKGKELSESVKPCDLARNVNSHGVQAKKKQPCEFRQVFGRNISQRRGMRYITEGKLNILWYITNLCQSLTFLLNQILNIKIWQYIWVAFACISEEMITFLHKSTLKYAALVW